MGFNLKYGSCTKNRGIGVNDDQYLIESDKSGVLYAAIADGMGGAPYGDAAARAATVAAMGSLLEGLDTSGAIAKAHEGVSKLNAILASPESGSTLLAVKVDEREGKLRLQASSVGDTLLLLIRDSIPTRLTDCQRIGSGSLLRQSLGQSDAPLSVEPAINIPLFANDKLIALTDGAWEPLSLDEIGRIVALAENAPLAAKAIIEAAEERNTPDDATERPKGSTMIETRSSTKIMNPVDYPVKVVDTVDERRFPKNRIIRLKTSLKDAAGGEADVHYSDYGDLKLAIRALRNKEGIPQEMQLAQIESEWSIWKRFAGDRRIPKPYAHGILMEASGSESSTHVILMERIDGECLNEAVAQITGSAGEWLDVATALDIMVPIFGL